jgi:hypothetical protein
VCGVIDCQQRNISLDAAILAVNDVEKVEDVDTDANE